MQRVHPAQVERILPQHLSGHSVIVAAPVQGAGEREFAQMKDGVRIVSLSVPGVVDTAAWARAAASGKVAASAPVNCSWQ